jgi:hypothetical protein
VVPVAPSTDRTAVARPTATMGPSGVGCAIAQVPRRCGRTATGPSGESRDGFPRIDTPIGGDQRRPSPEQVG